MNRQGIQMAINAIYQVIRSIPIPYPSNLGSYNPNNTNSDITPQQFINWINYLYNVLDIAYQNLGLYDFMMMKNNIIQIVQQSDPSNPYAQYKMSYLNLANWIKNELLTFVQYLLQY